MEFLQYSLLFSLFINSLFYTTCTTSVQEEVGMDLHPFVKIGSKYYLVHALELNWHGAAHLCRSYDSDLLTIESEAEMNALFSHLRGLYSFAHIWTSSNDLSDEGKYVSLNSGRPMIYTFWGPNEPNNAGDVEDCVEVLLNNVSFTMNDNNCSKKMRVICEKRLPLNTRNSATNELSMCEQLTTNCTLKALVDAYLQTSNINNCRA
ncbi:C-type lectin 37Db [Zeugodacus cucurbitae]|uniref:C-type lectin 37Db n=1 Tax=Zeugodacus cucurbitae TaxID=28588 RepID=UPI0023D9413A|nr:C-type lectin 37Db [Zeugodacus cucurbitae]